MSSGLGRAIQILLVAARDWPASSCSRCAGRWWELLALATPIVLVTAVGAVSLAAPRRNEVLMTLIFPLAALALSRGAAAISSAGRMVPQAGIFPAELTALRSAGCWSAPRPSSSTRSLRRRSLRNVDVLILLVAGLGLVLVSGTEIIDGLLSAFSFEKGNGGRILGLAVFAIFILFLLILRALSQAARNSRQLSAALEGLAWEEFRQAGPARALPRTRSRSSSPPTTRPRTSASCSTRCRPRSAGCATEIAGRRRRLPRRHRRRRRRARRRRSPATSPTAAAARRCAPATG